MGEEKPNEEAWKYISPHDTNVHKSKAGFVATIDTSFIDNYVSNFMEILEESIQDLMPPEDFCTTKVFLDDQPVETVHTNLCLSKSHTALSMKFESK